MDPVVIPGSLGLVIINGSVGTTVLWGSSLAVKEDLRTVLTNSLTINFKLFNSRNNLPIPVPTSLPTISSIELTVFPVMASSEAKIIVIKKMVAPTGLNQITRNFPRTAPVRPPISA